MKCAIQAALVTALTFVNAASASPAPPPAQTPAHVKAVQDLLAAMHVEKELPGVAATSRYSSEAQRQAVYAKLGKVPPAEIYRRMAAPLAPVIAAGTAVEMTRFYNTPYGQQVIHNKYNSGPQIMLPGARARVPVEEQKERKRPEYVRASKALADAQPAIAHEAFVLLQQIDKEKR